MNFTALKTLLVIPVPEGLHALAIQSESVINRTTTAGACP
jgi:hypothetical protein